MVEAQLLLQQRPGGQVPRAVLRGQLAVEVGQSSLLNEVLCDERRVSHLHHALAVRWLELHVRDLPLRRGPWAACPRGVRDICEAQPGLELDDERGPDVAPLAGPASVHFEVFD